jgi:hypothetical protein
VRDNREGAERYLLSQQPAAVVAAKNVAALDFEVAWHGHPIGTLHHDGFEWRWRAVLRPAVGLPFTHILKPAGTAGFEQLPLVEWLCLELGRGACFDLPAVALVEMPDGMSPALVVERFDVRRTSRDQRMLALEDFCSVLDLPAAAKYDGLREVSLEPASLLAGSEQRAAAAPQANLRTHGALLRSRAGDLGQDVVVAERTQFFVSGIEVDRQRDGGRRTRAGALKKMRGANASDR